MFTDPLFLFALVPWLMILGAFGYGLSQLKTQRTRQGRFTFRNVGTAWMFQGLALVFVLTGAGILTYGAGGCTEGSSAPVTCSSIPDGLGHFAFALQVANLIVGPIGLPLTLALATALNFLSPRLDSPRGPR